MSASNNLNIAPEIINKSDIPLVADESHIHKIHRSSGIIGIIALTLLIVLFFVYIANILKTSNTSHRSDVLQNMHAHERNLCKTMCSKSVKSKVKSFELIITKDNFPNATAQDLENLIKYHIIVSRNGIPESYFPNMREPMPSTWVYVGSSWKSNFIFSEVVDLKYIVICLDTTELAAKNWATGMMTVTSVLRNKLGHMNWKKEGSYMKENYVSIEIDADLFK